MAERITPQDFATGAPPRIMGTEAEDHVNLLVYTTDPENHSSAEDQYAIQEENAIKILLSDQVFERANIVATRDEITYKWLANAQLLYKDRKMLESCTAESLGPKQTVAATLAGIKILKKLGDASELPMRIFRRSATVNDQGRISTSGFHMNHITPENSGYHEPSTRYANPALEAHSATRLYTWGGMVGPDGYSLSQKGVDNKNFYRYKETEFGYTRIEDYSGEDSGPWGTFMALATTSVLFRVQEHPEQRDLNKRLASLELVHPGRAIRTVAADLPSERRFRLLMAVGLQL